MKKYLQLFPLDSFLLLALTVIGLVPGSMHQIEKKKKNWGDERKNCTVVTTSTLTPSIVINVLQNIYTQTHIYCWTCSVLSCVWLLVTLWTAAHQAPLFSTISWSLLKLMSTESVKFWTISSSATPSLFAFTLSQHQSLSNETVLCIRWPKYWSLSFSWSCIYMCVCVYIYIYII